MAEPARVALLVTCLVDLFRPSVGFASVKLLEEAGCDVEVPENQTCCGQPAFNSGDRKDTADIARAVIKTFSAFDYVVAPSGSCAGMIKAHYPELFAPGSAVSSATPGATRSGLTRPSNASPDEENCATRPSSTR